MFLDFWQNLEKIDKWQMIALFHSMSQVSGTEETLDFNQLVLVLGGKPS